MSGSDFLDGFGHDPDLVVVPFGGALGEELVDRAEPRVYVLLGGVDDFLDRALW